jgi:hypothetical protein
VIFYTETHEKSRVNQSNSLDSLVTKANREVYKKEFFRVEIFILLAVTFFTYFNQTSLETMVIPFTELMFGWNELHNSILFCIGGCIIILSYVMIRVLTTKFNDRAILLIGLVLILTGLVIGCTCLPFAKQLSSVEIRSYKGKLPFGGGFHQPSSTEQPLLTTSRSLNETVDSDDLSVSLNEFNRSVFGNRTQGKEPEYDYQFFPAFVVFVILDVLGLPAIAIASASLFTKLIDNKVQGVGQGIQRGLLGMGTIFGPLCAGPLIMKPVILLAITLSIIAVIFVAFLFAFPRLKPRTKEVSGLEEKGEKNGENEKSALTA